MTWPAWIRVSRTAAIGLALSACSTPVDSDPAPPSMTTRGNDPQTTGSEGGDDTSSSDSGSDTGSPAESCDDVFCGEFGRCEMIQNVPQCTCDEGYVPSSTGECVIDEGCIQVRPLLDDCRQIVNGAPAVAVFFGVDFCAGPAVTQDKFEELELELVVTENDQELDPSESFAGIVSKDVENYVALVLDMSQSLAQDEDLSALVAELRSLVESLQPGAGEPDVYVSLFLFARQVSEVVPFTRNLALVRDTLSEVAASPDDFSTALGPSGTSLFEATEKALLATQRIRDLRHAVTDDGVLTTGTVVVVTDGVDSSMNTVPSTLVALLRDTTNQVVSIGVSEDVPQSALNDLGRDGSFQAPTPDIWPGAFAQITQRVKEYPDRSYLLTYCSAATSGDPTVEVSVQGPNVTEVASTAACRFSADDFGTDPINDVCNAALFETNCDSRECGGLTACGACADDQCCLGRTCGPAASPTSAPERLLACTNQPEICLPTDEICNDEDGTCTTPLVESAPCDGPGQCAPFDAFCVIVEGETEGLCVATLPAGSICTSGEQCATRNCYFRGNNTNEEKYCLREAREFEHCSTDDAICENGAFCAGSTCEIRRHDLESCSNDGQCRSGFCAEAQSGGRVCDGGGACFWSWDEKIAG